MSPFPPIAQTLRFIMSFHLPLSSRDSLTTPDRQTCKPSPFTFSKPPTASPGDSRTAPEFSLHSPTPIRRQKGHSVELFSPCDSSTIASTRHNSSFVGTIAPSSLGHSRSISALKKDELTPTKKRDPPEIESIKHKLQQQELRLQTFLRRAKEKEAEAAEAELRCRKLTKELQESSAQVGHLRGIVEGYERQVDTLVGKTTNSLERVLQQKNCEILKLKSELSLFRDQYEAKLEAEVFAVTSKVQSEHGAVTRMAQELEFANAKVKHLTVKNKELFEEIAGYQRTIEEMKKKKENGNVYVSATQVSPSDFLTMQQHFHDLEDMQSVLLTENKKLKAALHDSKTHDSQHLTKTATLCGELFKHRCGIALLSRVLRAIRDGETFNLSMLLRSKFEAEKTQGSSLDDCIEEAKLVVEYFEELENSAVEWYSAHCGESCRIS